MICYHCNETIPDEATHCYYCGARVDKRRDNDDYIDTLDDLIEPIPAASGYDYLDDYEPERSRALPIALSVLAALLLVLVGIYFMSQATSNRKRNEQLQNITLPTLEPEEALVPVVAETTKATAQDETKTTPETTAFSPPTVPYHTSEATTTPPVVNIQPTPTPVPETTTTTAGSTTYTVVSGDSFWRIAEKVYGRGSMELATRIASANGRQATDSVFVGETLSVPAKPAEPTAIPVQKVTVNHTVKAGENYWTIASKYYGTATQALVNDILTANGRTANATLKVGDVLAIPNVPETNAPSTNTNTATNTGTTQAGSQSHVVQANDSYWSIATKYYGTANFALAEKIAAANNRTINDKLNTGETIIVPPR